MFELWESRDYAGAGELVDPDVVFTRVGSELGHLAGEWRGLSSAWAAMVDFMRAWKDLHTLPERFFDLPDDRVLACAKQIGRAGGAASWWSTTSRSCSRCATQGHALGGYWDRGEAMRAGGLREEPQP
jgi:hypothetical protein